MKAARLRLRADRRPRVVVVTGGTRGLGRALARAFGATGDTVWSVARSSPPRPLAGCRFVRADVTRAAELAAAAAQIRAQAGRIDVWINNAGGGAPVPFIGGDPAAWQAVFDLNFSGTVNGCRAALGVLRAPRGCIINVASLAGLMAPAGHSAYTAAKAAVIALTQSLAVEYAAAGIRLNAVAPGPLDSPGFRATPRARNDPHAQIGASR